MPSSQRSSRVSSPAPPAEPWRTWVERWTQSGLSARAFAALHGLRRDTLYGWRRRVRAESAATAAAPAPAPAPPRILPVTFDAPVFCELQLRDGRVLRFPSDLTPAVLRGLVRAVAAS